MREEVKIALFGVGVIAVYAIIFAPELVKEWPVLKSVVKGIFERPAKNDGPDTSPR